MRFVETHCHLNHPQFAEDREAAFARARAAGVTRLVLIGCDPASNREVVEMASRASGVFATVGIHPHDAEQWSPAVERDVRELAARPEVVAIGEIGLDFYRDLSPRDAQERAFRVQLDLAAELGMPIVVHTRESICRSLEVLEPYARAGLRGVMHCWSGTAEEARQALELGFHLGVGGVLTYKKPGELPEVVREAPPDRLVLETDSPYLPPVPHRGKRNEPAYIPLIAERVAELRGVTVEEVARATTAAAEELFGLESTTETQRHRESHERS